MSLIYVYEDEDEEDAVYIYILGTWVDTSTQSDAEETSVLCIYVRILRRRLPLF